MAKQPSEVTAAEQTGDKDNPAEQAGAKGRAAIKPPKRVEKINGVEVEVR